MTALLIRERNKIVREINDNIDSYDETITSAIERIQDFEKTFCKCDGKTHLDSLSIKRPVVGNQQQWDQWARMNSELVNLITKRVEL